MTVRELYDGRFGLIMSPKWREQLLDRPAHKRQTPTDMAEMVLELDEGSLTELLAFTTCSKTDSYIAGENGVWERVNEKDHHLTLIEVRKLSQRLDNIVLKPMRSLVRRLQSAVQAKDEDSGNHTQALAEAKEHLKELLELHGTLRTPYKSKVMLDVLTTICVESTRMLGTKADIFDTLGSCIAFEDGVYVWGGAQGSGGRLLRGPAARRLFQTQTVGYDFSRMRAALLEANTGLEGATAPDDDECLLPNAQRVTNTELWQSYDKFMIRTFSATPEVRPYVIDLLASSVLNENRQVVVFHHNVAGSNGKSTLFGLIKEAYGKLYIKCGSSLLAASSSRTAAASGPNEDLVSTKGKRVLLFSEPDSKHKLSAAVVKELTGGDEQSTRGMYAKKETFVVNGMPHVLCNKIPELDDMDGGVRRRLRCIPYGATFVDDTEESRRQPLPPHHYYKEAMAESFGMIKYGLMWEVMVAASKRVAARMEGRRLPDDPPAVVLQSTKDLIERENTVANFIGKKLEHTKQPNDCVTLKDAYEEYKQFCREEARPCCKKSEFSAELSSALGERTIKSNSLHNVWRGWRIIYEEAGVSSTINTHVGTAGDPLEL